MSAVHVPKQLQPTFLTVRHSPTYATDFASSLPANTSYLCNHPAQPRRASTCRSDGRQAGASLGFPQSQSKVARELWTSLGIRTTCGRAVAELRRTAPVRPTVSLQRLSCSERNIQQRRSSRRSRCQRSTRRSAHRAKERNVRRSLGRVLPRVLRFEDCGTCCKMTCARISTGKLRAPLCRAPLLCATGRASRVSTAWLRCQSMSPSSSINLAAPACDAPTKGLNQRRSATSSSESHARLALAAAPSAWLCCPKRLGLASSWCLCSNHKWGLG